MLVSSYQLVERKGTNRHRKEDFVRPSGEAEAEAYITTSQLEAPSRPIGTSDRAKMGRRRALTVGGGWWLCERNSQIISPLERPAGGFMRELLKDAAERAARYLSSVSERSVAPRPEDVARLSGLGGPMPEGGMEPAHVLAMLDEIGSPATVASAGPRYFGFVIGGSLPATLAANWLAGAWDQDAALGVMSPSAAAVEEIARVWLCELLGLPASCGVGVVTGATMANFACLAAARHALLSRAGWNVEEDGLFGAPPLTVVVGEA